MDTTDFTNGQIDQQEQQQFDEDKRMDEEDHGFDKPTDKLEEVNIERSKAAEDLLEQKRAELHESTIKDCYRRLYALGCNKDTVRDKMEHLTRFFGNLAIGDMSQRELESVRSLLAQMELQKLKFDGRRAIYK